MKVMLYNIMFDSARAYCKEEIRRMFSFGEVCCSQARLSSSRFCRCFDAKK